MPTLVNIAAFNVIWLVVVGGAFSGLELPAMLVVAAWVAVHLRYSRHRASDIRLIVVAMLAGPLTDTLLIQFGLIDYVGYAPIPGLAPLWIVALWVNFALLPNHSLHFMRNRLWLAALAGAIFAPLTYRGGVALGAAELAQPEWLPLAVLAAAWAIILPALMRLSAPEAAADPPSARGPGTPPAAPP